jgi:hypothetical protein
MGCLNATGNCRHIAAGRRRDGIYKRGGTMKTWSLALGIVALALVSTATAADPTGTWKWSVTFNNQTREQTLKLNLEGDKLTGAIVRGDQETAIGDASFKDDTISFTVTRERNGMKFVSKYSGKLDGDAIKGKIESERDGQKMEREWNAKREK